MAFDSENDGLPPKVKLAAIIVIVLAVSAVIWQFTAGDSTPAPTGPVVPGAKEQPVAEAPQKPAFDLVRIARGGTGVIAGRVAPNAHVTLYANDEKIAEVDADAQGEWVIVLEKPLEAGSVALNLKSHDPATGTVSEADDVVVVSVPEPDDRSFAERDESGVVAVLSPKSGEGGSRLLQKPGTASVAEVGDSLSVDSLDYGDGGSPVISGRALPRVDVRVYVDDNFIGVTRVKDDGTWSVTAANAIGGGRHTIRVDQTIGKDGTVQLRIEQPVESGLPLDPRQAAGGVIVQPGNTLWHIARQLYGSGVRYTMIFKENSEVIRDPDLIYPGQLFRLPEGERG
ncbi:LysM peptidoglycan-binding domain-containing protein [Pseudokordiimonas caeni]|uniref:LysM peptidoglycan-binding domain-containing protein n=1 Tax=Pseudokordiimonas caeni TaxID=2997908 RepID=UPI002811B012|nr:LysM peptidoglycan-binding domain-containing protein [Pseudokordiimonas caeni]